MIKVTRINDEEIIVNAVLIEFIEATPDTVISLVTGKKLMVKEAVEEVRGKAENYHRTIGLCPRPPVIAAGGPEPLDVIETQ